MYNKKVTVTAALLSLFGSTFVGIFAINKAVNKLAISKELLREKKKETYHWRFGDISYSKTGKGRPVLLIHNLRFDSSSVEWLEIVPRLSKTNTVYTIDLLGCGLSDRPNLTYTCYMYVQLINDFVQNIIKRKTSIIATGKSAAFILGACSVNPESFDELILINPENIRILKKTPTKRTKTTEFILKIPSIGTFIYHIAASKNIIEKNFDEKYFYDGDKIPKALIDYYYESAHLMKGNDKNLFISLIGRYANANIVRTLRSINQNIHILAGREIPNIESSMKEYQYYNPAIEIEYLDYTKELPQLEAPDEVMKYIDLYLYH